MTSIMSLIKIASVTHEIVLGSIAESTENVIRKINELENKNVDIAVFPAGALTGVTLCSEAVNADIIKETHIAIKSLMKATENKNILVAVSVVLNRDNKQEVLYIRGGKVVEKLGGNIDLFINNLPVVGITEPHEYKNLTEIISLCSDAKIILHMAAKPYDVNSYEDIEISKAISKATNSIYVYAASPYGESTTDFYYKNDKTILCNGDILKHSGSFDDEEEIITVVNTALVDTLKEPDEKYNIAFDNDHVDDYVVDKSPYLRNASYQDIIETQFRALVVRMEAIKCDKLILGISGGLDSTLALIASYEAMKYLGYPSKNIITVSMPGFGTSSRTKNNAKKLMELFDTTILNCDICEVVSRHLSLLGHDGKTADVVFENAQARERTQILMDLANKYNGLVIGTGDLSEIALGFATFNGDHMSNYSINASIPKTLMREVIKYYYDKNPKFKDVLADIIETPVSPELLPNKDGNVTVQKTEEIVGPYELHDFFIYYHVKYSLSREDIFLMACAAFKEDYSEDIIKKWLDVFYRRFFKNQFKRNCSVDGPKVTEISLSPREGYRFPSDVRREWK